MKKIILTSFIILAFTSLSSRANAYEGNYIKSIFSNLKESVESLSSRLNASVYNTLAYDPFVTNTYTYTVDTNNVNVVPVAVSDATTTATVTVPDANTIPPTSDPYTLSYGERGIAVRSLQRNLKDSGFNVPQTGEFDANTANAVVTFQQQNGYTVTPGYVNIPTAQAIVSAGNQVSQVRMPVGGWSSVTAVIPPTTKTPPPPSPGGVSCISPMVWELPATGIYSGGATISATYTHDNYGTGYGMGPAYLNFLYSELLPNGTWGAWQKTPIKTITNKSGTVTETLSGLTPSTKYNYSGYIEYSARPCSGSNGPSGGPGSGNESFTTSGGSSLTPASPLTPPTITSPVYVADTDNNRIQEFTSSGTYVTQWGTNGIGNGQFYKPYSVAVAPNGNVYVSDTFNNRIQEFDSNGTYITKWGKSGGGNGQFNNQANIAVAPNGNVYVADNGNDRIQEFTSSGTYVTQWGTSGTGNGQFYGPFGIAVATNGTVYVAENTPNGRIQEFTSNGIYIRKWGTQGTSNGQFNYLGQIFVAPNGSVYAVDSGNNRIQKFTSSGIFISTFGWGVLDGKAQFEICSAPKTCQAGIYGTDDGQFMNPFGVAVASNGNVYVADGDRIQEFTWSGTYLSKWGTWGTGNGDFGHAMGIAVGK